MCSTVRNRPTMMVKPLALAVALATMSFSVNSFSACPAAVDGLITVDGLVTTGDWGPPGCVIDSATSVDVTVSGDIWAYGGGINILTDPAENAGTGQINNYGRIGSPNSYGISLNNGASYDSITNHADARIEGHYYGIELRDGGTLQEITNSGTISGGDSGIRTVTTGRIVQINNTAEGTISGYSWGILAWGGQIDHIDNHGLIQGHLVGIQDNHNGLWGWEGQIGQIDNSSSGIIRANNYAIQLDHTIGGVINNAGWIDGQVRMHGNTLNLIGDNARVSQAVSGNADSEVFIFGNFASESSFNVGSLHIESGAQLQMGHHTVFIHDALYNSGTLLSTPGVTSSIYGHYVQQQDGLFVSQLQMHPEQGLQYGRLFSTQTVDLGLSNQFAVDVLGSPELSAGSTMDNVIFAYGGLVNAELPTVVDNSALFDFIPTVDSNNTRLSLTITPSSSVTAVDAVLNYGNRSALGVAGLIDNLIADSADTPEQLEPLITALGQIENEKALANGLDQLLPALNGNLRNASLRTLQQNRFGLNQRLGQLRGLSAGGETLNDRHLWIIPVGSRIDQSRRGGVPGYDADIYGLSLGADTMVRDDLRVGFGFAYLDSQFKTSSAARQSADSESYLVSFHP